MTLPDQYGRTGREWRYCSACDRQDALRIRGRDGAGVPLLECVYCKPVVSKPQPAPEGIFA